MGFFKNFKAEEQFKMETISQPMSLEPSQHRHELVDRLDILRKNESFCDVTIAVKGKEFKAHKAVLAAASPFFLTLLTSDMIESKEQLIKIELEEATAAVMEDVVKYVYTGNVLVTEERAHNLIATADYLLLTGLKTLAFNFLKEAVTIENCIFNYYFADKYQCLGLKEKSCHVINSNFTVVMEREDFLKLDKSQVMEWVSSDDIIVGAEEDVFKGIVKWVSHNKSEREGAFPELLHQIRLASVSFDFVLNKLMKEELFKNDTEFGLNYVVDAVKFMLGATDGRVNQQPRKSLGELDGMFVCGGRKALCYIPLQNTWYKLAVRPVYHGGNFLVQLKSKIYTKYSQGGSKPMEYYIPATNSWGTIEVKPDDTSLSCCAVLKGDLYAADFNSQSEGKIFRYDVDGNFWHKLEVSSIKLDAPCFVSDDKYLYIIGGRDVSIKTSLSKARRLDPSTNEWTDVADINERRYHACGAVMNGKIFIAGGQQTREAISSCEVYDPSTDQWQLMPSLRVPRHDASMVCVQGKLYVLGGTITKKKKAFGYPRRVLSVEMFDLDRDEWIEKSAVPVDSFETLWEAEEKNQFQACFARLYKDVIDKLVPIN